MSVRSFVAGAFTTLFALAPGPTASAQTAAAPAEGTQTPAGPVRQLGLDEAVQLALEQNLDVQVQRINPQIQDENVAQARAAFLPSLTSDLAYRNAQSPPDSFLSGAEETLTSDFFQTTAGVEQRLPWGGASYSFGWDGSRSTSNNVFQTFNPRLGSNLAFSFSQPLLKDFSTDASRTQLVIGRRNREISDVDLQTTVVQTIRGVRSAYWDLKYAVANLQVQQQSLDLARQTLKDNRTRVEVGTMAPIDIVEAEAEVARNEETVIIADAAIRQAEDQLRALIFDPAMPDFWQVTIDPVEAPRMNPVAIDIDGAIRNALDKRTDLRRAKASLENVADNLKFYKNQALPQVSAQLNYGATGLGGTQLIRGDGFPGPIVGEVSRGFGSVLSDVLSAAYPTWTLGVVFSYPLGRSTADAGYARSQLEQNQGLLQIKNLELQIGTQVRDIGRQVSTNTKRIDATRAARLLAERRLEAEQKKFGVGMSTSFLVFQAQRDLATARVNELRAILDYNKSLADFEAVQEAALSGSGITISGGGSTLSTTAGATISTSLTQGQR